MEKKIITVPFTSISEVNTIVEKLNKKASKFGIDAITFEVSEPFMSEREVQTRLDYGRFGTSSHKQMFKFVNITLFYSIIKIKGEYEVLGTVERREGGNLVHTISDSFDFKPFVKQTSFICKHCNTKRATKNIIIVRNINTDEIFTLGKKCLADYMGIDVSRILNNLDIISYIDLIEKDITHMSSGSVCMELENVLSNIYYAYHNGLCEYNPTVRNEIKEVIFENIYVNEAVNPLVNKYITYLKTLEDANNNFLVNLYTITCDGIILYKDLSMVIGGFCNWMKKQANVTVNDKLPNNFFGEVKKRDTFELVVTQVKVYESNYGVGYIVMGVQAGTGNKFKWFTANPSMVIWDDTAMPTPVQGKIFKVKATVKAFDKNNTYGNATLLTRIKVVSEVN